MTNEVDVRGFVYPLEPLLKRHEWDIEALQLKLGQTEGKIRETTDACGRTEAAYEEHARAALKMSGVALDPASHSRWVAHLAHMQGEIARASHRLEELREERRLLREEYLRIQVKANLTSSHKDECLKEYALAQQNRMGSERDRDWLARAAHLKTQEGA